MNALLTAVFIPYIVERMGANASKKTLHSLKDGYKLLASLALFWYFRRMAYSTSQSAKLASISPSSVRAWTAVYNTFFTETARPPKGQKRSYMPDDIALLLTIKELKSENREEAHIIATLADGYRVNYVEPPSDDAPVQSDTTNGLITKLTATVANFEGQLTTITNERDRLITRLDKSHTAALDAEIRATAAETEVKLLREQMSRETHEGKDKPARPSWWHRLVGKG